MSRLLALATGAGAAVIAVVTFLVLRDDPSPGDPPLEPVPASALAPPGAGGTGDAGAAGLDVEAVADRLVAALADRSGVTVTASEGRCLADATLEVIGVERLADAVSTGQPVAAAPAEESTLLRAVVACVDASRAAELLGIVQGSAPAVPLPGEEP